MKVILIATLFLSQFIFAVSFAKEIVSLGSQTGGAMVVIGESQASSKKQQCMDACIAAFEKPGPELKACVTRCSSKHK